MKKSIKNESILMGTYWWAHFNERILICAYLWANRPNSKHVILSSVYIYTHQQCCTTTKSKSTQLYTKNSTSPILVLCHNIWVMSDEIKWCHQKLNIQKILHFPLEKYTLHTIFRIQVWLLATNLQQDENHLEDRTIYLHSWYSIQECFHYDLQMLNRVCTILLNRDKNFLAAILPK